MLHGKLIYIIFIFKFLIRNDFTSVYGIYVQSITIVGKLCWFFLTKDKEIRWEQSMYTWKLRWVMKYFYGVENERRISTDNHLSKECIPQRSYDFCFSIQQLWDMLKYINIPQFKYIVHTTGVAWICKHALC